MVISNMDLSYEPYWGFPNLIFGDLLDFMRELAVSQSVRSMLCVSSLLKPLESSEGR